MIKENSYTNKFEKLPLSARLTSSAWSGDYWPTFRGGISMRWSSSGENPKTLYGYKLKDPSELSDSELQMLSPAEKYDVFMGKSDYPLTKMERKRTQIMRTVPGGPEFDPSYKIPHWEGLCHAWAPAALSYKNPGPVTVKTHFGGKITFAAGDVKALLTYFLHVTPSEQVRYLGERCNVDFSQLSKQLHRKQISEEEFLKQTSIAGCRDTNAGAFHIILTNQIALQNEGFIADLTRDSEVWNHPVIEYSSKILEEKAGASPGAAAGTIKEIKMETIMVYLAEAKSRFEKETVQALSSKTYHYRLELDINGEIIGGAWIMDDLVGNTWLMNDDRPDFLWKQTTPKFSGYFSRLAEIYNASTQP